MIPQQKLESLQIGESELFPISEYKPTLNNLIQRLSAQGMFFKMKSEGKKVRVTKINKQDKSRRKPELLSMGVGDIILEYGDNYRIFHVTIQKLNRNTEFEWSIFKDKDIVEIKRVK